MQTPIVIDPTWLSVGHVDEMLSFVPDKSAAKAGDPWPWKMLLISPRLGYVLAYAASANANNGGVNVNQLLTTAQQVNDASRQAAENWATLRQRCQLQFGNLLHVGGGGAGGAQWGQVAGPGGYSANPAPPANQNGKVVLWQVGGNYQVQSIDSYLARPWDHQLFHETAYNIVQPRIDAARQTLRQELGNLEEKYVIEVPALLDYADNVVTHSADSVNMLVLRTGANAASCLVPKPFGPVCGGVYLFQSYLQNELVTDMGLTATFVNDWEYLHSHHGEVHCGTNQIPRLLPDNRAWWLQEPP
jgi:protein-arginine deiminase